MTRLIDDRDYIDVKTIESATDAANAYIDISYGKPEMSLADTKAALVMMHRALLYQTHLNASLHERIVTLEDDTKKKFFRRK